MENDEKVLNHQIGGTFQDKPISHNLRNMNCRELRCSDREQSESEQGQQGCVKMRQVTGSIASKTALTDSPNMAGNGAIVGGFFQPYLITSDNPKP